MEIKDRNDIFNKSPTVMSRMRVKNELLRMKTLMQLVLPNLMWRNSKNMSVMERQN